MYNLVESFLRFIRDWWKVFALFNLLFFGCVLVVVLLAGFTLPLPFYQGWSPNVPEVFLGDNWLVMVLGIFVFNFCVSAFVVVTLPGIIFFPLSVFFLFFRAVLWGLLLYALPTWLFFAALPTIILEGEAYVFAAVAGTIIGTSWIKPDWIYHGSMLSRADAFKRALGECLKVHVFVAVLLFVAAVVEATTITFI